MMMMMMRKISLKVGEDWQLELVSLSCNLCPFNANFKAEEMMKMTMTTMTTTTMTTTMTMKMRTKKMRMSSN